MNSFDRNPHKTSNESSSGYVIDYEQMLKEAKPSMGKNYKKSEF
jgi:hypothetical protein